MESNLKELHSDLLKTTLRYKNYNLLFLSQIFITESCNGTFKLLKPVNVIKKLSLDNLIRWFLFKISNPLRARRENATFDYLFVNEVYNKAVMSSLYCVTDKFTDENAATLFSDTRMGKPDLKSINTFEMAGVKTILASMARCIMILPTIFKSRREIFSISKKYNVSPLLLVLNFFDSVFVIKTVEKIFEQIKVKKIILMTDVHKLSRVLTLRASELDICSFVIQHGATIGDEGYLPITANKMLAWGESSKDWFVERKQSAEKIQVIGSPRMDSIKYEPGLFESKVRLKKVLVVMSEVITEEIFLEKIKDAFVRLALEDVEISIKLHPGGSVDYSFIPNNVFKSSGLLYRVLRFEDMKSLLMESDIVIVTTSTVGMEAIIFKKPIFQYKSEEILNFRMSYEDFDCSHIYHTSEDLCRLLSDGSNLFSKNKNYDDFIRYYFYKLDGNSAQRAKDFIVQTK